MPPPPAPPPRSYLWRAATAAAFDSDSEADDDDAPSLTATTDGGSSSLHPSPPVLEEYDDDDEEEEEEEEEEDDDDDNNDPRRRQDARRRRKQPQPLLRRRVAFGTVRVHALDRCLGAGAVPSAGSWPLGVADAVLDYAERSVDAYEDDKQARLRRRLQEWWSEVERGRRSRPIRSRRLTEPLETRQWDYLSSRHRNPLFGLLPEKARMGLLLDYSSDLGTTDSPPPPPTALLSVSPPSPRRSTRARSGSWSGDVRAATATATATPTTRRRANSVTAEHFNDAFSQPEVHRVRNELEELRNGRTREGAAGCACRKLSVYLVPPGGGRKAHHRRISVQDLKRELRRRHLLPDEHRTREELERLLHDAVEREPCCNSDDCFCVRNGINCQADACQCWYPSHQTKENNKKEPYSMSSQSIIEICGNRNGMYAVDLEKINAFRKSFLDKMALCQTGQQ